MKNQVTTGPRCLSVMSSARTNAHVSKQPFQPAVAPPRGPSFVFDFVQTSYQRTTTSERDFFFPHTTVSPLQNSESSWRLWACLDGERGAREWNITLELMNPLKLLSLPPSETRFQLIHEKHRSLDNTPAPVYAPAPAEHLQDLRARVFHPAAEKIFDVKGRLEVA